MANPKATKPEAKAPTLLDVLVRTRGTLDAAIAAGDWERARTALEHLEQIHTLAKEGA